MSFTDCFVPGCNFTKKEDDPQCERSNRTMEFENAYNQTSDCIFSHKKNKSLACIECADLYNDLNKRYDQIRLKAENKFCFVIKFWVRFVYLNSNRIKSKFVLKRIVIYF